MTVETRNPGGKLKQPKDTQVVIRLPSSDAARLRDLSSRDDVPVSQLVRRGIRLVLADLA